MKIMIVDDHPLVRRGLETVIHLENDMEVVGTAANGEEAMNVLTGENPDIALVDLRLPGEDGLDIISQARSVNNRCKYIVLTSYASKDEIRRAIALDVDGYILKEALPEEVISSIRLVAKGRKYYDPVVVQHTMEHNRDKKNNLDELTCREREVLSALANGLNNKAIANNMFISEHTVKKHLGQIFAKLNLQDRTQAALYAVSKGVNKDIAL
jgi:DNA-binding NarL/FixJ family response regulator